MTAELSSLVALSRALGEPSRELAILAEGNTSIRSADGRMLVKASGRSLRDADQGDFVELELAAVVALVDAPATDDAAVAEAFRSTEERTGLRPSVEALLHAVCLTLGGAQVVGHSHPVAVLSLLCGEHAERLATDMLFPDQIVVLGPRPLYVPYADPGLELARRVRDGLREHVARHGEPPKVIYLGNHGMFALGQTGAEVVQITEMAVKAARILAGALAAGGARPLPPAAVARIDGRPDEDYRRRALAGSPAAGDQEGGHA